MNKTLLYILLTVIIMLSGCSGILKDSKTSPSQGAYEKPLEPENKVNAEKVHPKIPVKTHDKTLMSKKTDQKLETEKIEQDLTLAKKFLKEENYNEIPPITERILKLDPSNKPASELSNEAYYKMGKALNNSKDYLASMKMFKRVEPGYRDIEKIITALKIKMKKASETHYRRGVKHYINERLKKAIEEWEKALAFNPEHPKARKDIEESKHLLEKLEQLK